MKNLCYIPVLALIGTFVFFSSCTIADKEGALIKRIAAFHVDTTFFHIDESTPLFLPSLHIATTPNGSMLCFLNELNHTFYYKKFNTRDTFQMLKLSNEGPNSIGPLANINATLGAGGLLVYNQDIYTLFLISLLDGVVLKKWKINQDWVASEKRIASPLVVDGRQMHVVHDSLLVMSGYIGHRTSDYTKVLSQTVFNLKGDSADIVGLLPYPEKYNWGNWGKFLYYMTDAARAGDHKIIVNFPLIDSIYVIDSLDKNATYSVPTLDLDSEINELKPLNVGPSERFGDKQVEQWYDFLNQIYLKVLFDEKSETIIRIFRNKPISKQEIKGQNGEFWKGGQYSLVCFSKDGSFLRSIQLPIDYYFLMGSFIHDGKLYLMPLPERQQSEHYFEMHSISLNELIEK